MMRSIQEVFSQLMSVRGAIALAGLALLGCAGEPTSTPRVESRAKMGSESAPPLKVLLVDADALQSELELRWQSFSEQGLTIQTANRRELATQPPSTVDLVIYPANLIGTLVARDWIAPVPEQAQQRIGGWQQASESNPWPSRWRTFSVFGGKPFAAPLGAPSWVAVTRSLDASPLRKLQTAILGNELAKEVSEDLWNEYLSKAEQTLQATATEREQELQRRLSEIGPQERRYLACRYLWILSTTESRYRGFFDTQKMLSRCGQPEFSRSALHLRRLALLQPSTIFASPTEAWDAVVAGNAVFGLGWPRTDNQQQLTEDAVKDRWELIPILWNDGSGLVASVGKRTRQSANATEFLIWLASEEQRIALQPKTATIELLEIDNDRNRVRGDYREYQTLQRLESAMLTMELTPRFLDSDRFMSLLEEALIDIFKSPETAEARMAQCRKEWDVAAEQLGREKLRNSIEAAIGYSE
ncbi:MAG: hypothetical protein ACK5AC_07330 [Planctomycetota bacterium]